MHAFYAFASYKSVKSSNNGSGMTPFSNSLSWYRFACHHGALQFKVKSETINVFIFPFSAVVLSIGFSLFFLKNWLFSYRYHVPWAKAAMIRLLTIFHPKESHFTLTNDWYSVNAYFPNHIEPGIPYPTGPKCIQCRCFAVLGIYFCWNATILTCGAHTLQLLRRGC